jgi:hypothetical protein
MLVQASAASCWVVESSTAAAVPLSLSARRDSERASRSRAVIALAEGGSGRSASSVMPQSVLCATSVHAPEQRSRCRRRIVYRAVERARTARPGRALRTHSLLCGSGQLRESWAYYGGLQFSPSTWKEHGGKGSAHKASKAEQIKVAERVLKTQGWKAWPVCSKKAGFR